MMLWAFTAKQVATRHSKMRKF